MSVPTNRDEARERLRKASLGHDIREVYPTIMDDWNVSAMQADHRAILSGPPEPSEEEVARVWVEHQHGRGCPPIREDLERARAIQALYRSRRNG